MSRSFDFAVNAEKVVIKQKGKNKYKVKLAGVGDFLKYQTWSSTNANNINDDRSVSLVHVKDWVQNNFGSDLIDSSRPIYLSNIPMIFGFNFAQILNGTTTAGEELLSSFAFAPTAVMEVNNQKYIFVIENASYNKKKIYNTVFNVSTNQIVKNNVSKHLVKLPINKKLHKVRFDIDSSDTVSGSLSASSVIYTAAPVATNITPPLIIEFKYYQSSGSIDMTSFKVSGKNNTVIQQWKNFASIFFKYLTAVYKNDTIIFSNPKVNNQTLTFK